MEVFKNIYNYRELLKTNIKKEIRGKYKHSFLGVLWSFLNPLLQIAIYAIIFPIILKTEQENYVIFLCVALIPWTYFTTVVTQSTGVVISNANIIKKVYFPREILPISVVSSATVNFMISTLIILAFVLFSGMGITWYLCFYPLILLIQYILSIAISFFVSSMTVYLRDLEHLIGIAIMVLFYGTPIVYSLQGLPPMYSKILSLNPMAHIIEAYRAIFYYQTMPNFKGLGIITLVSIILCVLGYKVFKKLEKRFAEEL
jgi:lipopolysaccharide transport system permease protein